MFASACGLISRSMKPTPFSPSLAHLSARRCSLATLKSRLQVSFHLGLKHRGQSEVHSGGAEGSWIEIAAGGQGHCRHASSVGSKHRGQSEAHSGMAEGSWIEIAAGGQGLRSLLVLLQSWATASRAI